MWLVQRGDAVQGLTKHTSFKTFYLFLFVCPDGLLQAKEVFRNGTARYKHRQQTKLVA